MSTPCIITAAKNPTLAIYIHWDGDDKQMIEDIVAIAKSHHARNPNNDEEYGIARLICACGEYFDNEETGFGISSLEHTPFHDYHWVINDDWSVEEATD